MTRRGVRRIVPLLLGWEELPKSVSVHGAPYEERLREPVPAVLLECDRRPPVPTDHTVVGTGDSPPAPGSPEDQ